MSIDRVASLVELASGLVEENPRFHDVLGPGLGDHATNSFMRTLRGRAEGAFGENFSEKKICGRTSQAVDFYFASDATVVEVALGLPNSASEFEKDILKALMAKECGYQVRRLVFVSRPGAIKKCAQPGRSAIVKWAKEKHELSIEVVELPGHARPLRKRNKKAKR